MSREVVSIIITPEMRDEAASIEAKIMKNLKKRDNYTELEEPGRYGHGTLGEIAVREWFERNNVRYVWFVKTDGRSHSRDFTIWIRGLDHSLDAKTASSPAYGECMMPEARFRATRCEYYVAARLMENQPEPAVDIVAWAPLVDVWNWRVKVVKCLTRFEEYVNMEEPKTLLAQLDRR